MVSPRTAAAIDRVQAAIDRDGVLSISGIREVILGDSLPMWRDELVRGGREISEALGAELATKGLANFG